MKTVSPATDEQWLQRAASAIGYEGFVIINDVLQPEQITEGLAASVRVTSAIRTELGDERLNPVFQSGAGEWRLVLAYDEFFLNLLMLPPILAIVHQMLGEFSVLRFQNVQVVETQDTKSPTWNQQRFHQNSSRRIADGPLSLEVLIPLTPIRPDECDFVVVPGTHERAERPSDDYLRWAAEPIGASPGSVVVFDSTLWHRESLNRRLEPRVFVVEQFTRSYVKPHFDHVRALGEDRVARMPEPLRRLLGWDTRLPTSLAEFYLPADKRLYKSGQD